MSNLMTWEEIEREQLIINNTIKEIEDKFINQDLEEDTEEEYENLSLQLEEIQKTILEFKDLKDKFIKDSI